MLTKPDEGRRANVLWWNAKKMCQGQRPPFRWCRRRCWGGKLQCYESRSCFLIVWDAREQHFIHLMRKLEPRKTAHKWHVLRVAGSKTLVNPNAWHVSYQKISRHHYIKPYPPSTQTYTTLRCEGEWPCGGESMFDCRWAWWASLSSLIHLWRQGCSHRSRCHAMLPPMQQKPCMIFVGLQLGCIDSMGYICM